MMNAYFDMPSSHETDHALTPIDLDFLSSQAGHDRELVEDLLHIFVKQVRSLSRTMHTESDLEAVLRAAHTLKGTARAVGAARIEASVEALERDAENKKCLAQLSDEVDAACDYVASLLR
ncbi:MAG: Hpt domain-containing protein [Pseudomonadota bacterium]